MKNDNDHFEVLRQLSKNPATTQRELSKNLVLSLGKINYCLKSLRSKGLIKINNFSKNKNRFNPKSKNNYFYILTPKGIKAKAFLTLNFMKKKMKEYEQLKKEIKKN